MVHVMNTLKAIDNDYHGADKCSSTGNATPQGSLLDKYIPCGSLPETNY